ncbi:hypothetical protein CR201_G0030357 [Pongo abelii]|uniref:Uncharacterized protein n=1 Tax=Pongo abelii TaxID=9601 RepID=A0A2J8U4E9_PONAB|nr:hypothetical protein CR201_G0030357 [Pongo abelii]
MDREARFPPQVDNWTSLRASGPLSPCSQAWARSDVRLAVAAFPLAGEIPSPSPPASHAARSRAPRDG